MSGLDLAGRVALVTGGDRGIGFATARALLARGASVVIVGLHQDHIDAAVAQLHDSRALGLLADVTDPGALQRAVATTVEHFGRLDVVVANAGIATRVATFQAMSGEPFDRVLDVNLNGVHHTVRAALPEILRNRGHIVLVSSIYAFTNGMGASPYAMAKAGVEQLGRALRVELAGHGVGTTVAYFGFIDTKMVHDALDADPVVDELMATFPAALLKRLTPQHAGEAIVRGIEQGRPRVIEPRRWAVLSALRGITGPMLDRYAAQDAATQAVIRKLDERADEEQPTTA